LHLGKHRQTIAKHEAPCNVADAGDASRRLPVPVRSDIPGRPIDIAAFEGPDDG